MTNAQTAAVNLRWVLLILALLCWGAGVFYFINPVWPKWLIHPGNTSPGWGLLGVLGFLLGEGAYWIEVFVYLGVFLVTQWLFLAPRMGYRFELASEGRPLRRSVMVAALMAAILSTGVIASILELAGVWNGIIIKNEEGPRYWPPLLVLGILWVIWAVAFFLYWRPGNRATQLERMVRGLIAGSILELLVAAPAHAWVLSRSTREDRACYCVRGSYTGLVLGGTVLLWAFGPGVALLFLREKERREKLISNG